MRNPCLRQRRLAPHAVLTKKRCGCAFAVFPTWAGLMATVALLPRGEEMMFELNIATVTVTLVGHLIFGMVLGLAFLKAPPKRLIRFAKKVTHSP